MGMQPGTNQEPDTCQVITCRGQLLQLLCPLSPAHKSRLRSSSRFLQVHHQCCSLEVFGEHDPAQDPAQDPSGPVNGAVTACLVTEGTRTSVREKERKKEGGVGQR